MKGCIKKKINTYIVFRSLKTESILIVFDIKLQASGNSRQSVLISIYNMPGYPSSVESYSNVILY